MEGVEIQKLSIGKDRRKPDHRIKVLIVADKHDQLATVQTALGNGKFDLFFEQSSFKADSFQKRYAGVQPDVILTIDTGERTPAMDLLAFVGRLNPRPGFVVATGPSKKFSCKEYLGAGADGCVPQSHSRQLMLSVKKSSSRNGAASSRQLISGANQEVLELLDFADVGILLIDPEERTIISTNDVIGSISSITSGGRRREPLHCSDLIYPDAAGKFFDELSAIKSHPDQPRRFRSAIAGKDGVRMDVIFTAAMLNRTAGNPIVMIAQDITELLDVERVANVATDSLLENEGVFQSLIRHVIDYAIFMLDSEGRVATWNIGAERLTGYDISGIIGGPFSILFPEGDPNSELAHRFLKAAQESGRSENETELLSKSGKRFWTRVTITPLPSGDGSLTGYSVILRDLTENRTWQQALLGRENELHALADHLEAARENERQRIARELHDEFGQMLTALRMDLTMLSRMISKTVDPVKQMPLIEKLSSTSQLVESTIRSTRRIITELRPAVLDELGLPTAILWQAQEFEDRTGIRCRIEALQHAVVLDEKSSTAIFRIFQEALTNVARHSGAAYVGVSAQVIDGFFVLKVADDGVGISEDNLRNRGSYGLLGIRERVTALNGEFEIQKASRGGTELNISIPYRRQ